MDPHARIEDLRSRILVERKCYDAAWSMLLQLTDENARMQCLQNIRDSRRRLEFLHAEMHKLQRRRLVLDGTAVEPDFAEPILPQDKFAVAAAAASAAVAASHSPQTLHRPLTVFASARRPDLAPLKERATASTTVPPSSGSSQVLSVFAPLIVPAAQSRSSTASYNPISSTAANNTASLGAELAETHKSQPISRAVTTISTSNAVSRRSSTAVFDSLLTSFGFRRSTTDLTSISASAAAAFVAASNPESAGLTASDSAHLSEDELAFNRPSTDDNTFAAITVAAVDMASLGSISEIGPFTQPATQQARTKFGFVRSDTILTPEKVKYRLTQARHHLEREQKIRLGAENMIQALKLSNSSYSLSHAAGGSSNMFSSTPSLSRTEESSNTKQRTEVEQNYAEATARINLLHKAIQSHQGIYLKDDEAADDAANPEENSTAVTSGSKVHRPQSRGNFAGKLFFHPISVVGLPGKRSSKTEVYVALIVNEILRAKTRCSRNRWNEDILITVDKAHEVEIAVYEKNGAVLATQWFTIADMCEEIALEAAPNNTSDQTSGANPSIQSSNATSNNEDDSNTSNLQQSKDSSGASSHHQTMLSRFSDGIEVWLDLEPAGQILVRLNFVPEKIPKKPSGPPGAVRRQKNVDKSFLHQGHKFMPYFTYNFLKCGCCKEFIFKDKPYRCENCQYMCHRRCYQNTAFKCITKLTSESNGPGKSALVTNGVAVDGKQSNDGRGLDDKFADQIKHRIPHRFNLVPSMSVNWCCHCGMMLPIAKKQYYKCTECGNTCHIDCMPLVPNFCGLSYKIMNQLRSIDSDNERAKKARESIAATPRQLQLQKSGMYGQTRVRSESSLRVSVTEERPALSSSASAQDLRVFAQEDANKPEVVMQQPITQDMKASPPEMTHEVPPITPPTKDIVLTPHMYLQQQQQHAQQQNQAIPLPHQSSVGIQLHVTPPIDTNGAIVAHGAPATYHAQQQQFQMQQMQNQVVPIPADGSAQPIAHVPGSLAASTDPMPIQSTPPTQASAQKPSSAAKSASIGHKVASSKPRTDSKPLFKSGPKGVGLDDFNFLAVIGKGNFGKVMLAEEKYTRYHYAIKVLKKEFIIENDEVESTKAEKRVFLTANRARHPFLVNLHSCFQTESRIYFVMEFVAGGDLMWHIQQHQFSERRAKFYACEVLLALEYFHQNNIVYRDLKLDNILLTPAGHIKIADYGLCKENMSHGMTTSTFCGTPEFMAPEILSERPYTRAVDWWAFGVLIYEMLLGQSPFKGDDEEEIFESILHQEILYPPTLAKDAINLLQRLLTKDPSKRLGGGRSDAHEIKQHPFFAGVNWDAVLRLELTPPFIPDIRSPTDISNFDEEFTREMPVLTPCTSVLSIANQEEFRGFTHISDWAQEIRSRTGAQT